MINKETSRKITGIILAAVILLVGFSSPVRNYVELPNELRLIKGDKLEVHPFLPVELHILNQDQILSVNGQQITDQTPAAVGLTEPLKLSSLDVGNVKVEFRLFGYVPLRTMEINVIEDRELVPGGEAIGIKAGTSEIVVSDYFYLETENGEMSPAKKAGIQKGDSLLEIEGHDISSLDSTSELLIDLLEKQDTDSIEVIIERSGKEKSKTIDPRYCLNLNEYGIGLYLTDSSLGVGTLTYKDFENKEYGALGHSISTWDSAPASLKDGRIVDARIIDINKGSDGKPGEKKGNFLHGEEPLGTIEKNTKHGIFGKITNESVYSSQIEPKSIGLAKHAEPGSAQILTVLDNQEIERFEIEIKRVFPHNAENGKGMVIEVTDEELLQRTGGIVQGMSGSPIIQDDKLIGAITHVFVNDSEKGYGTFLEWMLYESEK